MAGLPILGVEATGVGTHAVLVQDGEVVSRFTEGPLNVLLDSSAFDRLANLIKESGAAAAGLGLAGLHSMREAPLLAVTVVGLFSLAWLHRALSHRSTQALLWAGFAVGVLAIAVDQWPEVQTHWPWWPALPEWFATVEEPLEVVAEALVLAALLRQPARQ